MKILNEIPINHTPHAIALGYFDGVHLGHKAVIKAALDTELATMVLMFGESGIELKGRHILSTAGRIDVLKQLGVQTVVMLDFAKVKGLSPTQFVRDILIDRLKAKAISCGFNYRFGLNRAGDTALLAALCNESDVSLSIADRVMDAGAPISSTRVKELLTAGDIKSANRLLGYPYFIQEEVQKGNQIGRTIGFRTINQHFTEQVLVPRYGIYATSTTIDGACYKSVTNIGVKPTIQGERLPLCETHILDFSGDLYGKTLRVEFLDFIRPELRFESLEELTNAIKSDVDKRINELQP